MWKRSWVASLAVGCLVAVGGCGSSSQHVTNSGTSSTPASGEASKPPATILSDAAAALRSARGYVVQGQIAQSGHAEQVRVVASGGSLDVVLSGFAGHLEARILPSGAYVRVDQAFLKAHGAAGGLLANRWIQIPATAAQKLASQLAQFTPSTAARCLAEGHGTLSLAGRTTVTGRPAIVIRDAGNAPGDAPGTLAVAATGTPYPLQVIGTGPKRAGGRIDACNDGRADNNRARLTFSHFSDPPQISTPPNALRLGQQSGAI